MATVQITGYRCERCDHVWAPRKAELPLVCPKCKNPYWNRPREALRKGRKKKAKR